MNILYFLQAFCQRIFYGKAASYTQKSNCYVLQGKSIPSEVAAKISSTLPTTPSKLLASRTVSVAPANSSTLTPFNSQPTNFKKPGLNVKPMGIQAQETLNQSLQRQIHQLEEENRALFTNMTVKQATSWITLYSVSNVTCHENGKKQAELAKLNARLETIYGFCNEEMIEVLNLVAESSINLNCRLFALREETERTEDENLLCANVEQIAILEKVVDALQQLESKFQNMQRVTSSLSTPSQSNQETYTNALLEKIDKLNKQKLILKECQQRLPAHAAYDAQKLQQFMQLFDREEEQLLRQTKETRDKVNQAEKFAHEVTNHLLDYAETFRNSFQKLQQTQEIELKAPVASQVVMTQTSITAQTYTVNPGPVAMRAQIIEDQVSLPLQMASQKVTEALQQLLKVTSSI